MKNILSKLLIIMLTIILLFTMYSKFIRKDKIINVFGYQFLIVLTGSMEPEIKAGSLIIIKKVNDYKIGDVVTYQENNYFITHRIIQQENDRIVTKGDYNSEADNEIDKSRIIGKVIFNSFFLGMFIKAYLKYIFFILTFIMIFFNVYWYIIKYYKKN